MVRFFVQVLLSLALGTLIGCERKKRNNEAGPRTHALVAMGSCIFMFLSRYGFGGAEFDASRVASSVVTGVGFLGAGVILYHRGALRGLTTAAGVWVTSGVGMLAGAGMEWYAAASAGVTVAFQYLSHLPSPVFSKVDVKYVRILARADGADVLSLLPGGKVLRYSRKRDGDGVTVHATVAVADYAFSEERIAEIMEKSESILSVEFLDEV